MLPAGGAFGGFNTDNFACEPIVKIYGDFQRVRLSDEGYGALVGEFGAEKVTQYNVKLDMYIESHGKDYASHHATIKKWVKEDALKIPGPRPSARADKLPVKVNRFVNFKQRDWDYAELYTLEREYLIYDLNKIGVHLGN